MFVVVGGDIMRDYSQLNTVEMYGSYLDCLVKDKLWVVVAFLEEGGSLTDIKTHTRRREIFS